MKKSEMFKELLKEMKIESKEHGWGILLIFRDIVKEVVQKNKPRIVVDVGCHNRLLERTICEWCREVGHKVYTVGIDVQVYEEKPEIVASCEKIPIKDNSVDLITIIETLEHVYNYVNCLEEIARIAKKSAKIIIQSPICTSPNSYDGDKTHLHVLHPKTLTRLLELINLKVEHEETKNDTFIIIATKQQ